MWGRFQRVATEYARLALRPRLGFLAVAFALLSALAALVLPPARVSAPYLLAVHGVAPLLLAPVAATLAERDRQRRAASVLATTPLGELEELFSRLGALLTFAAAASLAAALVAFVVVPDAARASVPGFALGGLAAGFSAGLLGLLLGLALRGAGSGLAAGILGIVLACLTVLLVVVRVLQDALALLMHVVDALAGALPGLLLLDLALVPSLFAFPRVSVVGTMAGCVVVLLGLVLLVSLAQDEWGWRPLRLARRPLAAGMAVVMVVSGGMLAGDGLDDLAPFRESLKVPQAISLGDLRLAGLSLEPDVGTLLRSPVERSLKVVLHFNGTLPDEIRLSNITVFSDHLSINQDHVKEMSFRLMGGWRNLSLRVGATYSAGTQAASKVPALGVSFDLKTPTGERHVQVKTLLEGLLPLPSLDRIDLAPALGTAVFGLAATGVIVSFFRRVGS